MYKIRLPNFEGPFDLLLYFIKRDELNIYDIPIAKITEEYLKYIRLMQYFDLELAGEFLVMVVTLMYIKTQMLLPIKKGDDNEEVEDPRTVLVQRLIEYKQYKEAAKELENFADDQKYVYYRNLFENPEDNDEDIYYENSTLFDLLNAFKSALDRTQGGLNEHIINMPQISISQRIDYIHKKLSLKSRVNFFDLVYGESRRMIVITFLAILEMMKNNMINIYQNDNFEDIIINKSNYFNNEKVEQIQSKSNEY